MNKGNQQKMVEEWNRKYRIGQPVRVRMDDESFVETVTTAPASLLSGQVAVGWFRDIKGCYSLDRVIAIEKPKLKRQAGFYRAKCKDSPELDVICFSGYRWLRAGESEEIDPIELYEWVDKQSIFELAEERDNMKRNAEYHELNLSKFAEALSKSDKEIEELKKKNSSLSEKIQRLKEVLKKISNYCESIEYPVTDQTALVSIKNTIDQFFKGGE